jgi:CRISPR/Cas system-associated exonuclease Cas4 (RecB family)
VGRILKNEFSWSKSRHERFAECRRSYYFNYYRSWGGWADDAPREIHELYILKKLSNRYTWSGSMVHAAIRGVLTAIRHAKRLEPARVIDRVYRVMREDFAFSRGKAFWTQRRRKDFLGLVEHEYAEEVADAAWKQNWDNVRTGLEWWFASRWPKIAGQLKHEQWLEVDVMDFDRSFFQLDGVRVFAAPDLALIGKDGSGVIVDWKTGKAREGYDDQVLGYALYLQDRYRLPSEAMRAYLVYVNEGVEQQVAIEPARLVAFKEKFSSSVGQMRALLKDAAGNVPLPEEHFVRTTDLATCARCAFRRPCGREEDIKRGHIATVELPDEPSTEPTT